jgi:Cse1
MRSSVIVACVLFSGLAERGGACRYAAHPANQWDKKDCARYCVTAVAAVNATPLTACRYAADPANQWDKKNCALYCVTVVAVMAKTAAAGATAVNGLVDVSAFYSQHVLPELTTEDVDARPVLKADCLRRASLGIALGSTDGSFVSNRCICTGCRIVSRAFAAVSHPLRTAGAVSEMCASRQKLAHTSCDSQMHILRRYVYMFRGKLAKADLLAVFPSVMRLLRAESNVVHSYAAIVIERLLALQLAQARRLAHLLAKGCTVLRALLYCLFQSSPAKKAMLAI